MIFLWTICKGFF